MISDYSKFKSKYFLHLGLISMPCLILSLLDSSFYYFGHVRIMLSILRLSLKRQGTMLNAKHLYNQVRKCGFVHVMHPVFAQFWNNFIRLLIVSTIKYSCFLHLLMFLCLIYLFYWFCPCFVVAKLLYKY